MKKINISLFLLMSIFSMQQIFAGSFEDSLNQTDEERAASTTDSASDTTSIGPTPIYDENGDTVEVPTTPLNSIYIGGGQTQPTITQNVSSWCFYEADELGGMKPVFDANGDPVYEDDGVTQKEEIDTDSLNNPFNLTPEAIALHRSYDITGNLRPNISDDEILNSYCKMDFQGNKLSFRQVCDGITLTQNSNGTYYFEGKNPNFKSGQNINCENEAIAFVRQMIAEFNKLTDDDAIPAGGIPTGDRTDEAVKIDSTDFEVKRKLNAYTTASNLSDLATDVTYKVKQDYLINLGIKRVPRVVMDGSLSPDKYQFRYKSGQTGKYEEGNIMEARNSIHYQGLEQLFYPEDIEEEDKFPILGVITPEEFPEGHELQGMSKDSRHVTNYGIFFQNPEDENITARRPEEEGSSMIKNYRLNALNTLGINHKKVVIPEDWAKITDNFIEKIYLKEMDSFGNEIIALADTFGGVKYTFDMFPMNYDVYSSQTDFTGTDILRLAGNISHRCSLDSTYPLRKCEVNEECGNGGVCLTVDGDNKNGYQDLADKFLFKTEDKPFALEGYFAVSGTCGGLSMVAYNENEEPLDANITIVENIRGECNLNTDLARAASAEYALLPKNGSCGVLKQGSKTQFDHDFQIKVSKTGEDLCKFRYTWDEVPNKIKYSLNDYAFIGAPGTLEESIPRYDKFDYHALSVIKGQEELDNILNGIYLGSILEDLKANLETEIRNEITLLTQFIGPNAYPNLKEKIFPSQGRQGRCVVLDDTTQPLNKNITPGNEFVGLCNTHIDCCGWEEDGSGEIKGVSLGTNFTEGSIKLDGYSEVNRAGKTCAKYLKEKHIYCLTPETANVAISSTNLKKMIIDTANGSQQQRDKLESLTSLFLTADEVENKQFLTVSKPKPYVCDNTLSKRCEKYEAGEDRVETNACFNQPGRTEGVNSEGETRCYFDENDNIGTEVNCGLGSKFENGSCVIPTFVCADSEVDEQTCEQIGTKTLTKKLSLCNYGEVYENGRCKTKKKINGSNELTQIRNYNFTALDYAGWLYAYEGNFDGFNGGNVSFKNLTNANVTYDKTLNGSNNGHSYFGDYFTVTGTRSTEPLHEHSYQHMMDELGFLNENNEFEVNVLWLQGTPTISNPDGGGGWGRFTPSTLTTPTNESKWNPYWQYLDGYMSETTRNASSAKNVRGEADSGLARTQYKEYFEGTRGKEVNLRGWHLIQINIPRDELETMITNEEINPDFSFVLDDNAWLLGPLGLCDEGYKLKSSLDSPYLQANGEIEPLYCEGDRDPNPMVCPEGYTKEAYYDEETGEVVDDEYLCKKEVQYCLEGYEGVACETDSDCKNEGKCIPNVINTPEYLFELLDVQSEVSFQKTYDWRNFKVPNSLDNLDIVFGIDTSGSVAGAAKQIQTIMKDLGKIINYNNVNITMTSGGVNTGWSYNRTSAMNIIKQLKQTNHDGDNIRNAWPKSRAKLKDLKNNNNYDMRNRLFVYIGDDANSGSSITKWDNSNQTTSIRADMKDYLNKNNVPSLLMQPLTCHVYCHSGPNIDNFGYENTTTVTGLKHKTISHLVSDSWHKTKDPSAEGKVTPNTVDFFKELDYMFVPDKENTENLKQNMESHTTDFYKTTINKYYWTYKPIFDDGGKWRETHNSRYNIFNYDNYSGTAIAYGENTLKNPVYQKCEEEIVSTNTNGGFTFTDYRGEDGRLDRKKSNTIKEIVNIYTTPDDDIRTLIDGIRQEYRNSIYNHYIKKLYTIEAEDISGVDILNEEGISELRASLEYSFDQMADKIGYYNGSFMLSNLNSKYKTGHENIAKLINAVTRLNPEDETKYLTDSIFSNNVLNTTDFNYYLGDNYDIDMPLNLSIASLFNQNKTSQIRNLDNTYGSTNVSQRNKYNIIQNTRVNKISFLTNGQYLLSSDTDDSDDLIGGTVFEPSEEGYIKVYNKEITPNYENDGSANIKLYLPVMGGKQKIKLQTNKGTINSVKITNNIKNRDEDTGLIQFNDSLFKAIPTYVDNTAEFEVNEKNIYMINVEIKPKTGVTLSGDISLDVYFKSLNIDLTNQETNLINMFKKDLVKGTHWFNQDLIEFENENDMLISQELFDSIVEEPEYIVEDITKNWYKYNETQRPQIILSSKLDTNYNYWEKINDLSFENTTGRMTYEKTFFVKKADTAVNGIDYVNINIQNKPGTTYSIIASTKDGIFYNFNTPTYRELSVKCPKDYYFDKEANKCISGNLVVCEEGQIRDLINSECHVLTQSYCVENDKYNIWSEDDNDCKNSNEELLSEATDEEKGEDKICKIGNLSTNKYNEENEIVGNCLETKDMCEFTNNTSYVIEDFELSEATDEKEDDLYMCVTGTSYNYSKDVECDKHFNYDSKTKTCKFDENLTDKIPLLSNYNYKIRITKEQNSVLTSDLSNVTLSDPNSVAHTLKCDNGLNILPLYNENNQLTLKCIDGINKEYLKLINEKIINSYKTDETMVGFKLEHIEESYESTKINVKYQPYEDYRDKKLEEVAEKTTENVDSIHELCSEALTFNFIGEDEKIRLIIKALRDLRKIITTAVEYTDNKGKLLDALGIKQEDLDKVEADIDPTTMKDMLFSEWLSYTSVYKGSKPKGVKPKFVRTCEKMKIKAFKIYYKGCITGIKSDNYCIDPDTMYATQRVPQESTNKIFTMVKKIFLAMYNNKSENGLNIVDGIVLSGYGKDADGNDINIKASDLFDMIYTSTNSGETEIGFKYRINGVDKEFTMNKIIGDKDFGIVINPIIDKNRYMSWLEFMKQRRCDYVTHGMGHIVAKYLTNLDKKIERIDAFVKSFINTKEYDKCVMDLSQKQHAQIDRDYFDLSFIRKYTSHMKKYKVDSEGNAEKHWACEVPADIPSDKKEKKCTAVTTSDGNSTQIKIIMDEEKNEEGKQLCKRLIPNIVLGSDDGIESINKFIRNASPEGEYLRMENYQMKQDNKKTNLNAKDLYGFENPYQTKICEGTYTLIGTNGNQASLVATGDNTGKLSGDIEFAGKSCKGNETISNEMYREFIDTIILDHKDMRMDVEDPGESDVYKRIGLLETDQEEECEEIVSYEDSYAIYSPKSIKEDCKEGEYMPNHGITTEYIYGDDFIATNKLENIQKSMEDTGRGFIATNVRGTIPKFEGTIKSEWEIGGIELGKGYLATGENNPNGKSCKIKEDYYPGNDSVDVDGNTLENKEFERLQYTLVEVDTVGSSDCAAASAEDGVNYELSGSNCVYVEEGINANKYRRTTTLTATDGTETTTTNESFDCNLTGDSYSDSTSFTSSNGTVTATLTTYNFNVKNRTYSSSANVGSFTKYDTNKCKRTITRPALNVYTCPQVDLNLTQDINVDRAHYYKLDITANEFVFEDESEGTNANGEQYTTSPTKCYRLEPRIGYLYKWNNDLEDVEYCPNDYLENQNAIDPNKACYKMVTETKTKKVAKSCKKYGQVITRRIQPDMKSFQAMLEVLNIVDMVMSSDKNAEQSVDVGTALAGDLLERPAYDEKTRLQLIEESCEEFKGYYVTRETKTATILEEKGEKRTSEMKIFINQPGLKKECVKVENDDNNSSLLDDETLELEEPDTTPKRYCIQDENSCPTDYTCETKWSEGTPFTYTSRMCLTSSGEWYGQYCFEEDKNPCNTGTSCQETTRAVNSCDDIYLTKEEAKKPKVDFKFEDLKESLENRNEVDGERKSDGTIETTNSEEDQEEISVEIFKDKTNKAAALNAQEANIIYNQRKAIENDGITKEIKDGQIIIDKRIVKNVDGSDKIVDTRNGAKMLKETDAVEGAGGGTLKKPSTLQRLFGGGLDMDMDMDSMLGDTMEGLEDNCTQKDEDGNEVLDADGNPIKVKCAKEGENVEEGEGTEDETFTVKDEGKNQQINKGKNYYQNNQEGINKARTTIGSFNSEQFTNGGAGDTLIGTYYKENSSTIEANGTSANEKVGDTDVTETIQNTGEVREEITVSKKEFTKKRNVESQTELEKLRQGGKLSGLDDEDFLAEKTKLEEAKSSYVPEYQTFRSRYSLDEELGSDGSDGSAGTKILSGNLDTHEKFKVYGEVYEDEEIEKDEDGNPIVEELTEEEKFQKAKEEMDSETSTTKFLKSEYVDTEIDTNSGEVYDMNTMLYEHMNLIQGGDKTQGVEYQSPSEALDQATDRENFNSKVNSTDDEEKINPYGAGTIDEFYK